MTIETTEAHQPVPMIPTFEGVEVHATRLKIANSSVLDLPDVVLKVDDIIQIVVEARVVQVSHTVDERSGQVVRAQVARPLTARLQPFVEGVDDGIFRG